MPVLKYEKTGSVVTLTIDRPESRNSLGRRATASSSPQACAAASTPTARCAARS